jgi:hypothetical protein
VVVGTDVGANDIVGVNVGINVGKGVGFIDGESENNGALGRLEGYRDGISEGLLLGGTEGVVVGPSQSMQTPEEQSSQKYLIAWPLKTLFTQSLYSFSG